MQTGQGILINVGLLHGGLTTHVSNLPVAAAQLQCQGHTVLALWPIQTSSVAGVHLVAGSVPADLVIQAKNLWLVFLTW